MNPEAPIIPPELIQIVPEKWRWLAVWAFVWLPFILRAVYAYSRGQGILGAIGGALIGTNTPKPKDPGAARSMGKMLMLAALCCTLAAGVTGCTTAPDGSRKIDPVKVGFAVEDAAFIGGRVALVQNPEWRPAFQDAVAALTILENDPELSLAKIVEIARTLHVRELRGEEASLIIAGAELLLVNLDRQSVDLSKLETFQPVVSGFRRGLERALSNPQP